MQIGETRLCRVSIWTLAMHLLCMGAHITCEEETGTLRTLSMRLNSSRYSHPVLREIKQKAPYIFEDLASLLKKWGYPLEEHAVKTEDGYLLTVHRVPHGRPASRAHEGASTAQTHEKTHAGVPVLLGHGLFSCSESLLVGGPEESPGLILADDGYDVWLINVRGTHYSLKHETLTPRDKKFWMYSMHEMGMYDLPATIDYILNVTNQQKLFYAGHSMGGTNIFITVSMRPEYNEKIRLIMALGPAVYFDGRKMLFTDILASNADIILKGSGSTGLQILLKTDANMAILQILCNDKSTLKSICALLVRSFAGPVDLKTMKDFDRKVARAVSSVSLYAPLHYFQMMSSDMFVGMDRGETENLLAYGSLQPPRYPLEKVTAPVAMYAAVGDNVVPLKGVQRIVNELPNVVHFKIIQYPFFNHFDFSFHPKVRELLLQDMLEIMDRF